MELLLENPLAMAALGAVLVTIGAIVSAGWGTRAPVVAAVLLAIAGLVAERLYETPHERVRAAVRGLLDRIEANDLAAVLALCDPAGNRIRADAALLMPMFEVTAAGPGGEVAVESSDEAATARLRPVLKARHKQSGATVAYFDRLELEYRLIDGRWLLTDYHAEKDWREGASRLSR